jgi:hypothetical protein
MTSGELVSHNHTDSGHSHGAGSLTVAMVNTTSGGSTQGLLDVTIAANAIPPLGFTGSTSSASASIQNTGSGGAFNEIPPAIVLNHIIKT